MEKYCPGCGSQLPDGAGFCGNCGRAVGQISRPVFETRSEQNALKNVAPNVVSGQDGKYCWIYEMSLFKNPTMFFTVWKVFIFVALGVFVFISVVQFAEGNMDGEAALNMLKYFAIALAAITVLVVISFLIYAAIMGGRYVAEFTMDEEGVNHAQISSQAKKARGIATASVLIGLATGSRAAVTGGIAASNTSMYTPFAKTRKVRFYPKRDLIKIRTRFFRNQIYAKPEDFDFIRSFVMARVPDKAKPGEKN